MTTGSFSSLHLTDFHFGLKGQDCLWPPLRQPFLEDLAEQGRNVEDICHAERAVAIFTELRSPGLAEAQAALQECQT